MHKDFFHIVHNFKINLTAFQTTQVLHCTSRKTVTKFSWYDK